MATSSFNPTEINLVIESLLERKSVSKDDLNCQPCEEFLTSLSDTLPPTPHRLARLNAALGLSEADLKEIETKYRMDSKRQVLEVLWKWKNTKENKATYLKLVECFITIDDLETAENIVECYKQHHCCQLLVERPTSTYMYTSNPQSHHRHHKKPQRGTLRPNNIFSKIFDTYSIDLVTIMCNNEAFSEKLIENLVANNLLSPSVKERAAKNYNRVIRAKMLIDYLSTSISRATFPENILSKCLAVFDLFSQLKNLVAEIKTGINLKPYTLTLDKRIQEQGSDEFVLSAHIEKSQIPAVPDTFWKYSSKLQSIYKKIHPDPKWSPIHIQQFVDLAVISYESEMDFNDKYSCASLHGSNDDIKMHKTPIKLDSLCQLPYESWVLILGAPGIGKSMLAHEICRRWMDKTALKHYALVLLLRLREKSVHTKWKPQTLEDLMCHYLYRESWRAELIQDLIDNGGEGVLIILEGYDELPEDLLPCNETLLLLQRMLYKASVFITTRSSASHYLTDGIQFTHHIEVLGFTKTSKIQCIDTYFDNEVEKKAQFKQYIKKFPSISGCLHVPLNLVIILYIFNNSRSEQLPHTMTELYERLVCLLIYRHLKSQTPNERITLSRLDCLPQPAATVFERLCILAYEGLKQKGLVFYEREDFETLGLMEKESRVIPDQGDAYAYSFFHLTIQEFLAAYHIYTLPHREICKQFNMKKNDSHPVMMTFLAGLTRLCNIRLRFSEELNNLTVFHQLIESNNFDYATNLLSSISKIKVIRIWPPATVPHDMYILGHCISLSKSTWWLGFTLRRLTYKHVKMLVEGIRLTTTCNFIIEHIGFSLNPIGSNGVVYLFNLPVFILKSLRSLFLNGVSADKKCLINTVENVHQLVKLEQFLFHNNDFKEDEQIFLIQELLKLKNLRHVSFSQLGVDECALLMHSNSNNSLIRIHTIELFNISNFSVKRIIRCLPNATALEHLQIHQSEVTSKEVKALKPVLQESRLKSLEFNNCGITSTTVRLIIDAVAISSTIESLNLNDNVIDDDGGCFIAENMESLCEKRCSPAMRLIKLSLDRNFFTSSSVQKLMDTRIRLSNLQLTLALSVKWEDYFQKFYSVTDLKGYFQFGRPSTK